MIAAAAIAALSFAVSRQRAAQPPQRRLAYVYPEAVAPHSAPAKIAWIDRRIAGETPLIRPGDWLSQAAQAGRYMDRARLSGDFADHAAAGRLLAQARSEAAARTGPDLPVAAWSLSVHRLASAASALDRMDNYHRRDSGEVAEQQAMRGDIAFYRGDYAAALKTWTGPSEGQPTRLALYYQKTGDPDRALVELDKALRAGHFITAQAAANIRYQRGLIELQRGHWPQAEAEFTIADRIFSGHWLVLQALAQMHALRGDIAGAVALYRRAIDAAHNPETMDALAALYREQGDRANADLWASHAQAVWRRWTTLLPEAAYAHALDHELAFGSRERAAALAAANWRARPYGASAVALGWALLANGSAAEAAALMDALNASAWSTAEQHIVTARAAELLGRTDKAETEKAAALALNPRVFDRKAGMIWIGH